MKDSSNIATPIQYGSSTQSAQFCAIYRKGKGVKIVIPDFRCLMQCSSNAAGVAENGVLQSGLHGDTSGQVQVIVHPRCRLNQGEVVDAREGHNPIHFQSCCAAFPGQYQVLQRSSHFLKTVQDVSIGYEQICRMSTRFNCKGRSEGVPAGIESLPRLQIVDFPHGTVGLVGRQCGLERRGSDEVQENRNGELDGGKDRLPHAKRRYGGAEGQRAGFTCSRGEGAQRTRCAGCTRVRARWGTELHVVHPGDLHRARGRQIKGRARGRGSARSSGQCLADSP